MKAISRRRIIWSIIALSVVLTLILGGYLFYKDQHKDLTNVTTVVTLVSRHMVLPDDETPALVTVTDPSKLTTAFLKNSKAGDKVLIYQTNKKAIIYRPSIDRIVAVGPVVIDDVSGAGR